ncbi:hypothetical protein PAESOLCIP111_03720 [Paenibacillus solanacearum]|uniref:Uncharacterized protein n=1 Tax=Paenibacillus solanacearum TaxID=2048548 RepID=A0A916K6T6_9BACL|nr:hypothetical protein [Paenibacillus solanacearum]CAG7635927.1 hypothetical protein PAESOLCIP111_03720 [Paenibacillus solanacearum]
MTGSRVLKWITGAFEVFLAIPVVGAAVVMGSAYTALGVMFILHVITLILSAKNKEPFYGSILGVITSVLAWVPLLGWILHLITGILLMVTASQKSKPSVSQS